MKCRVSFFNKTVFLKDLTRFAPAWILYSLVLVVMGTIMAGGTLNSVLTYGIASSYYYETSVAANVASSLFATGIISCLYALLNTQLLFGDLFHSKLTNALHALPLRREAWFGTHVVTGILFSLVPNLVLTLVFIPLLKEMWAVAWFWLLAVSLQYLFYFGLGVFACMCVGNRFAQGTVYALGSLLGILISWIADAFYVPLMPGIYLGTQLFYPLCPMIYGYAHRPFTVEVKYYDGRTDLIEQETLVQHSEEWIYLTVIALIGITLLLFSLQMYRKRQLESAGDFISVSWLKPVFLVLYTLAVGMGFQKILNNMPFLVCGLLVGYISGTMFLERTLRVFHKRMFAGLGVFALVLMGSMGITAMDPLDLEHWVPDPAQIEHIRFSSPGISYSAVRYNSDGTVNTQMSPIEYSMFTDIHQTILSNEIPVLETKAPTPAPTGDADAIYSSDYYYYYGEPEYVNGFVVTLNYTLENGVYLNRSYHVAFDSPAAEKIEELMNEPYMALGAKYQDWEKGLDKFRIKPQDGSTYLWPSREASTALMDAIYADLEAGTAAQHDYFHEDGSKVYSLAVYYGDTHQSTNGSIIITVYEDMENTVQWLQDFGLLDPA